MVNLTWYDFTIIAASGGDIIETAIELAPLDHDTSYSRKRVSRVVYIIFHRNVLELVIKSCEPKCRCTYSVQPGRHIISYQIPF